MLDVNPAALIAGGVDRTEVIGLPLWTTAVVGRRDARRGRVAPRGGRPAPPQGRFTRFDVDLLVEDGARRPARST